jgi:hypothetical protein
VWIVHDLIRHPKVRRANAEHAQDVHPLMQILDKLLAELDAAAASHGEEEYLKSSTVIPFLEACVKVSPA